MTISTVVARRRIEDFYALNYERGEIRLHSVKGRAFILPTGTWIKLRKELTRVFNAGAVPFMFQIGYAFGSAFAEAAKGNYAHPEDFWRWLPDVAASSGWGTCTITGDLKGGTKITINFKNCPFCADIDVQNPPACSFLVGVLNGIDDTLYDKPHHGEEIRCDSFKDGVCEVTIQEVAEKTPEQRYWGTYAMFPGILPSTKSL